jgi:AcrR family transcriptional regulator
MRLRITMASRSQQRSSPKPRGHGGERREEILDAALGLFAANGVHAVSTRQIAQAVGVSQPTLYAYFATKDDLLEAVCVKAFGELERRSRNVAVGAEDNTLESITRGYVRFGLENPDAYRIAFMLESSLHRACEGAPAPKFVGRTAFLVLRDVVARTYAVSEDEVELVTQSWWAGMHGLTSLLIARPNFPWINRDTLIEAHVQSLHRAWSHLPRR